MKAKVHSATWWSVIDYTNVLVACPWQLFAVDWWALRKLNPAVLWASREGRQATDGKAHGGRSGLNDCGQGWDWKKPVGERHASEVLGMTCVGTDSQDPGLQTDGQMLRNCSPHLSVL